MHRPRLRNARHRARLLLHRTAQLYFCACADGAQETKSSEGGAAIRQFTPTPHTGVKTHTRVVALVCGADFFTCWLVTCN